MGEIIAGMIRAVPTQSQRAGVLERLGPSSSKQFCHERKEALVADQPPAATSHPAGAAWRAAVMLFCLIGLPLAALRGTSWNELAKTVPEIIKGMIPRYFGEAPVLARESSPNSSQPCLSSPLRPRVILPARNPAVESDRSEAGQPRGAAAPPTDRRSRLSDAPLNPRVASQFPIVDSDSGGIGASPPGQRSSRTETSPRDYPPLVSMAWHDRKQGTSESPPFQDAVIRPEATAADASPQFQQILERLRALGAVHYMLETWGNDAQRFRFHCKMALRSNPNYIRHFEAIDRDAVRAMSQVLAEVEAWRQEQ